MTKAQPHYLVVGADSMVGGALLTRLRQSAVGVTGTTRRRNNLDEKCVHLDLSADLRSWNPPQHVDVAILCAGVTGLKACKDNPAESRRINVKGITALAKNLHDAGAFVIYLSTNQVFDGSTPFRLPRDPNCPVTEYGRQKAEAERRLGEAGAVDTIVRLTKVLGPQNPLFSAWTQALQSGQSIQPFSDMSLAPVPLSCVVSFLQLIAARRLGGAFHVSGEKDITYEEAARIGVQAMGADVRLVQPVKVAQVDAQADPAPTHTTLNMDALKSTFGVVPPDVRWTVEAAFLNPQLLAGA